MPGRSNYAPRAERYITMLFFSLIECMVVGSSILLVVLLLSEILDWMHLFTWVESEYHPPTFSFGYSLCNGPHMWKNLYPESAGKNQSPINIKSKHVVVLRPSEPLRWKNHDSEPLSMTLANDCHKVVLGGSWSSSRWPSLQGGSLQNKYYFFNIYFHWGPSNDEGSEHTLDYVRYPMELQAIYTKRGIKSLTDAIVLGATDGIVALSFFLQINDADNPYLDHILTNLWRITSPGSKVYIPPFPLEWLFTPFDKNYYEYNGSLSQPPCSEIVTWIVQKRPIAISSSQAEQFRKMCSLNGFPFLINCNCRPVQLLNDRNVYFYEEIE